MGHKSSTASLEREQLWLIVQNAREGIAVTQDGVVVFCNPRVCEILGYSEIELQSRGMEFFIHPEDREIVLRHHASRSSGQDAPERYEHRLLRKSGESVWVEVSGTLIEWKGKPATLNTFIDISKRKNAEKNFRESSFRYQNLIQTMKYGVEEVDLDGRIVFHNDACSAILGYNPGELVGTYIWDHDPDQDHIDRLKDYFEYIKTEKPTPEPYVSKNVKKTGEVIDVVVDWDYLNDQDGSLIGFISVVTDITLRKKAEESLSLQGLVLDQIQDRVVLTDLDGTISYINDATVSMLGYKPEEILGKSINLFGDDPETHTTQRMILEQTLRDGSWRGEVVNYTSSNEKVILDCRIQRVHDQEGKPVALCGISTDITKQKLIETALREAEEKYRLIFELSLIGIATVSTQGGIRECNKAFAEMLGYSTEELKGRSISGITVPEDYEREEPIIKEVIEGRREFIRLEKRYIHKDGHHVWVDLLTSVLRDNSGAPLFAVGTALDITERKRVEEEFRKNKELLDSVVKNIPGILYKFRMQTDGATDFIYVSEGVQDIFGVSQEEAKSDVQAVMERIHKDDLNLVQQALNVSAKSMEHFDVVHRVVKSDKNIRWIKSASTPIKSSDGSIVWNGVAIDISEQKKAEQELQQNEQRYRLLAENTTDSIWSMDSNFNFTYLSPSTEHLFGYPVEAWYTLDWTDVVDSEHLGSVVEKLNNIRSNPEIGSVTSEALLKHKDGHGVWVEFNVSPTYSEDNALQGFVGVTRDITERKESERRISSSKSRFHSLFDNAGEGIFIADGTSTITDANQSAADILGYKSPDELVGLNAKDLIHPDDLTLKSTEDNLSYATGGGVLRLERRYHRADGSYLPVRVTIKFIGDSGVHHVIFSDISERKRAEQALKKSEERVRRKLKAILDPEDGMAELELSDIIDPESLQSMMDNFYQLTGIGIGIIDIKGNVLVGTGWQDICTRFHRVHPETAQACKESDLHLSLGVPSGDFRLYRCKNNMWDIATPLMIGDKHFGNIFLGQFFFEDEEPDREAFRRQAQLYGFDEQEYLDALDRVPRWNRERVDTVMRFYSQFAESLASLSYGNIKLAWAKAEQDRLYDEMRLNQERLSLAVEMANMGHWEMDIPTMSFTFNEQFYSIYATTSKQEGGFVMSADDYARNFVHPDEADLVSNEISNILSGEYDGKTAQIEHRIVRRDGVVRHIVVRYLVIKNSTGERTKTIGVNQDITDRIVAESSLKESEDKFRSAFLSSPDAININRLSDGLYIDINQGFTSLTGFTPEDVKGKTSKDINVWCDYKDHERLVSDLKTQGYCSNLQAEFRRKDKSITTALMSARVISLNGEPHLISIARDISDRITAENLLADARNEFESIFENSHVGIMFLRGGRVLHRGNQRLAEILGFDSPEDMAGVSMRNLHIDEAHYLGFGERYYQSLSSGEQTQIEYQLKKKDGEPIWCSLSGKAIDPNDLDKGVIWVVDDLSNRKAMEESLIQAKEEAERANKAKSEFLANMSHEIRTPLNGIIGMLQLLKMSSQDEEQQEFTDNALLSGKRLTRLLSDILDISAVEAGKLSLNVHAFNPKDLLNSVETLLSLGAKEKGVDLRFHSDPTMPDIMNGDETRLRQILFNLVGNGLKFTTKGYVSVNASLLKTGESSFSRLLFVISDTGPGLDDQQISTAFEMFGQVSQGYTRTHQGAGLGLPIVKRLTDLMGGTISVDSTAGEGTTFYVSIPIPDALDEVPNASEIEITGHETVAVKSFVASRRQRILLAEDELTNSFAAAQMLKRKGYDVVTVANGALTIEALQKSCFDVILMDIQMPVMDGIEATKKIREGEAGDKKKNIPIIAMTAYAMDGDRERFLEAGMNGYVAKPVDMEQLESILNGLGRSGGVG
ncbi:MAG: PAS domain S-box protein [Desulfomonilaceae bacterium]